LLLERRVVEFVPDQRIPRHRGKRVLQGAFLVLKPGKFLPDGRPSGRLIMDVRATNALMRVLEGDMDKLPLPSQFMSIILPTESC